MEHEAETIHIGKRGRIYRGKVDPSQRIVNALEYLRDPDQYPANAYYEFIKMLPQELQDEESKIFCNRHGDQEWNDRQKLHQVNDLLLNILLDKNNGERRTQILNIIKNTQAYEVRGEDSPGYQPASYVRDALEEIRNNPKLHTELIKKLPLFYAMLELQAQKLPHEEMIKQQVVLQKLQDLDKKACMTNALTPEEQKKLSEIQEMGKKNPESIFWQKVLELLDRIKSFLKIKSKGKATGPSHSM